MDKKSSHPIPESLQRYAEGIKPNEGTMAKFFFAIAAFTLLLSSPVILSLPSELAKGEYAVLFALIFPLIGIGFLYHGFKLVKSRRLFGPALLTADPLPGCAGGQVGGSFEVSADSSNEVMEMRLECIKITRGRKSSKRTLLWQDHQKAFSERSAKGSKHTFSFDVSDDQPATEAEGRRKIQWVLRAEGHLTVDGCAQPFSRSWDIPVVKGVAKTVDVGSVSFRAKAKEQKYAEAKISANEQISLTCEGDSLQLISRSGRHGSSALGIIAMGAVFASIGFVFTYLAWAGTSAGSWAIGIIFSLVGLLIIWGGVWSWGRRLEVVMQADELWLVRSLFGKALYQRTLSLPQVDDVETKSTMSSSKAGEKTTEYFALISHVDGKRQKIAEGIEGRHAAEALLAEIKTWLQTQHVTEMTREEATA